MRWNLLPLCVSVAFSHIATARAACFDFNQPIETALEAPVPLGPSKSDRGIPGVVEASGTDSNGVNWAEVRGSVPISVADVVAEMKTQVPRKGKSGEMVIMPLADPVYMVHQKIRFSVKPLPFVHVEWIEDWAYTLAAGTKQQPEKVVVGYEKTSGSSHVDHLCGSMVITRSGEHSADVKIYEEIKATRRNEEDNLNSIRATLHNLQLKGT